MEIAKPQERKKKYVLTCTAPDHLGYNQEWNQQVFETCIQAVFAKVEPACYGCEFLKIKGYK